MTELQGSNGAGENGADPGGKQNNRGDTFLEIPPHARVLNENLEIVNTRATEAIVGDFPSRWRGPHGQMALVNSRRPSRLPDSRRDDVGGLSPAGGCAFDDVGQPED